MALFTAFRSVCAVAVLATAGAAVATTGGDDGCSSSCSTSKSACASDGAKADTNQAAVQNVSMKHAASARSAKLIVITFRADWCGLCKSLEPKITKEVAPAFGSDVLFVALDLTSKDSMQAEFMLSALRLGDLWTENAGKTGFALLVDPASKKAVGTLQASQSGKDQVAAVKEALKS